MIHICKLPRIVEETDRWGRGLGTYYVDYCNGVVSQEFYNELVEFETYKPEDDRLTEQVAAGAKVHEIQAPKMQRLLNRSKFQIWEFNMMNYEGEYIRSYANLGKISLSVVTPQIERKVKYLKLVVWFMNLKSKLKRRKKLD